MAWNLGDTTLPTPYHYHKEPTRIQAEHVSQTGKTTRDIKATKNIHILEFRDITETEFNEIISEWEKETAVEFSASATGGWGSISVSAVDVFVDLDKEIGRGAGYKPDFTLILTEVN